MKGIIQLVSCFHASMVTCLQKGTQSYRFVTGRNEVVAKVMFLLVSVILLTPQEDGYCCGRYASYWNAFLLCESSLMELVSFQLQINNK